jgi:hypothetical protein
MNVLVKICGITTVEALEAAVSAGADAVGFVFHESSPRNVSVAGAALLAARLPPGIRKVAVTLHPAQSLIDLSVPCLRQLNETYVFFCCSTIMGPWNWHCAIASDWYTGTLKPFITTRFTQPAPCTTFTE